MDLSKQVLHLNYLLKRFTMIYYLEVIDTGVIYANITRCYIGLRVEKSRHFNKADIYTKYEVIIYINDEVSTKLIGNLKKSIFHKCVLFML